MNYDHELAKMAGNIASGLASRPDYNCSPYATTEQIRDWGKSVGILSMAIAIEIIRLCESKYQYDKAKEVKE